MSMIQISKRQKGTSKLVDVLIRIGAIVLSLIFIGIVLAIMGYDPFKVFGKIIQTPFKRFKDVMNKTIMLTTLSLGIAIAFRMKFWNIGAEGQFYMGAFGVPICRRYSFYRLCALQALSAAAYGRLSLRSSKLSSVRAKRL